MVESSAYANVCIPGRPPPHRRLGRRDDGGIDDRGPSAATLAGNVAVGAIGAPAGFAVGTGAAADFTDAPSLDFYPSAESDLVGAGAPSLATPSDFNGQTRADGAPDAGAYERLGPSNPGWSLGAGFKDTLFHDAFESGDTSAWSSVVP